MKQPMIDSPNIDVLRERIHCLEEERSRLLNSCSELRAGHDQLLEAVAVANQKQIAAEMLSMELEQVFTSCADAMWVVRDDKTVVRANSAMLTLLGRPAGEVVGRQCRELLDAPLCNEKCCPLNCFHRTVGGDEHDLVRTNRDGEQQHFIVTSAPLVTLDGSPGIVAQFKDITDRKNAEAALAKANVTLAQMARFDSLTQLPNRRAFDETMEREWRRLSRLGHELSLVLCDVDCFKQYNDTYGHQAGDKCLQMVAQALDGCARRAGDLACRYGGEEFVFVLPDTPLVGARRFAERVRTTVEALALPHASSLASPVVTLSLGVATQIPCSGGSLDDLIKLADEALYQAKKLGRNRVVAA